MTFILEKLEYNEKVVKPKFNTLKIKIKAIWTNYFLLLSNMEMICND